LIFASLLLLSSRGASEHDPSLPSCVHWASQFPVLFRNRSCFNGNEIVQIKIVSLSMSFSANRNQLEMPISGLSRRVPSQDGEYWKGRLANHMSSNCYTRGEPISRYKLQACLNQYEQSRIPSNSIPSNSVPS
jgi:hypothetical protein